MGNAEKFSKLKTTSKTKGDSRKFKIEDVSKIQKQDFAAFDTNFMEIVLLVLSHRRHFVYV